MLSSTDDSALQQWLEPATDLVEAEISRLLASYVEGTRLWLLEDVKSWIKTDASRVLWLKGQAGVGKSVISALIVDTIRQENQIGGSFFCKSSNQSLKSSFNLVTTLAYSLKKWSPPFAQKLLQIKASGLVDITKASPSDLFLKLILEPLMELNNAYVHANYTPPTILLVIDALDECDDPASRRRILQILSRDFKKLPSFVKILVTSRPEDDIVAAFAESDMPMTELKPTDENNKKDAEIVAVASLIRMKAETDSIAAIATAMVEKSDGLFIWLVMALLAFENTSKTIQDVESLPKGLTRIYESTFDRIYGYRTNLILDNFLGLIAVAIEPMNANQFVQYLDVSDAIVRKCVARATSVLSFSNDDTFTFLHKSVSDFLTSSYAGHKFFVPKSLINNQITWK
ncbi:hypothetical protein HK100_010334, partial [Physocladia obscura]